MGCDPGDDLGADGMVRCPTCGARQPWSDTCRRCKSDLSLLRRVVEALTGTRRSALAHLRSGRLSEALCDAETCWLIDPSAQSARLVAVCQLLLGRWEEALRAASRCRPESGGK